MITIYTHITNHLCFLIIKLYKVIITKSILDTHLHTYNLNQYTSKS